MQEIKTNISLFTHAVNFKTFTCQNIDKFNICQKWVDQVSKMSLNWPRSEFEPKRTRPVTNRP